LSDQEITLNGIAVSPGIGVAPLSFMDQQNVDHVPHYQVDTGGVAIEETRFSEAIQKAQEYYVALSKKIANISGQEEAKIFEAHHLMLQDSALLKAVNQLIEQQQCNAEHAFNQVMQGYIQAMGQIDDPYMKERQIDLLDVCSRVLKCFATAATHSPSSAKLVDFLLLANDLTPSDTAEMDKEVVRGFATEQGSFTSHTAILARSLGIPAVVGVKGLFDQPRPLEGLAIIDGYEGKVIFNPAQDTQNEYAELIKKKQAVYEIATRLKDQDAITLDGKKVRLVGNAEFENEIPVLQKVGAKGIGLLRTEFFLLDNQKMPTEDEQFEFYKKYLQNFPEGVTIRTLDAGGDKLPAEKMDTPEPNPFLGWRGIRVSLTRRHWFREQVRAILRASAFGKVRMMFPMVSGQREIDSSVALVENCKEALESEGYEFDPDVQVGCTIEVPSAVLIAEHLAKKLDFFSIGTNDLIQYTIAVDRINPLVANLYDSTHPAVVRLMDIVVNAGNKEHIETSVCGEVAGDINLTPLLLGLGVQELSVSASQLPFVKKAICSLNFERCRELAAKCKKMHYSSDIYNESRKLAAASYRDIL